MAITEKINQSETTLKEICDFKQFLKLIEEAKNDYLEIFDPMQTLDEAIRADLKRTTSEIKQAREKTKFFDSINDQLEDIIFKIKEYKPTNNEDLKVKDFFRAFKEHIKEKTQKCPYCQQPCSY